MVNFNVMGIIEVFFCEVVVELLNSIDLGIVFLQMFFGYVGVSGVSVLVKLVFFSCFVDVLVVIIVFSGISFDSIYVLIYKNFQIGSNGVSGVGLQLQSMVDQQFFGFGDQYFYIFGDDVDIYIFNMVVCMFLFYGQVRFGMVGFIVMFDVVYK